MYYVLVIIAIIVCVLIGLIILIQNPKGGGLASGFAGSNSIMGVQRTGDFLEKGTWVLAIILMVLAMLINVTQPGGSGSNQNDIQDQINKPAAPPTTVPPNTLPVNPADTTKK